MAELNFYLLDKTNAGPFAPYLLPGVRNDIGAGKDVIAVGASVGENTVGAVAAGVRGGTLHILSLYVEPAMRRQGIGTALLFALGAVLREAEAEIDTVRTYYMEENEDTEAVAAFLDVMGFGEMQLHNRLFSVNTAELHGVPGLGEAFSFDFVPDPHTHPYSEITPEQLAEVEADESVLTCLKPSAMSHGILRRGSTIWVEDGHVLGWVLCYQGFDGEIVVTSSVKREGAPKGSWHLMLLAAANRCYTMLGRDFLAYMASINEHSGELVEKATAGNYHEHVSYFTETDELPVWLTGGDEIAN